MKPAGITYLTARRIGLLAEQPRMLYAERVERARLALRSGGFSPLDVLLVAGADDADVVAAHGLRMIEQCADHDVDGETQAVLAARVGTVLDALSALDIERRHAVRMLLPREFRELADRDPLWEQAYEHDSAAPEDALDARADLEPLLADDDWWDAPDELSERDRAEFAKFAEGSLRRQLGLDTRGFLTAEQEQLLEIAQEVAAGFLAEDR